MPRAGFLLDGNVPASLSIGFRDPRFPTRADQLFKQKQIAVPRALFPPWRFFGPRGFWFRRYKRPGYRPLVFTLCFSRVAFPLINLPVVYLALIYGQSEIGDLYPDLYLGF